MKYEKPLPEWLAEGLEPPQSKKVEGWQQGDRPPAEWWNWQMNKTYEALEELQEKSATEQQLDERVNPIENELTLNQKAPLALQEGIQAVNVLSNSALNVQFEGRTLVNLLGRDGNCEDLSRFGVYNSSPGATVELDENIKKYGLKSFKFTGNGVGTHRFLTVEVNPNSYYVAILEYYHQSGNEIGGLAIGDGSAISSNYGVTIKVSQAVVGKNNEWQLVKAKFKGDETSTGKVTISASTLTGTSDAVFNVDGIRLYELTEEEYNALDGMTDEEIAALYPYVDSVQHTRNPYVIVKGKNICPTSPNDWEQGTLSADTGGNANHVERLRTKGYIPIVSGSEYVFSKSREDIYAYVYFYDKNKEYIDRVIIATPFNTPINAVFARILLGFPEGEEGLPEKIKSINPQLELGDTATEFEPHSETYLFGKDVVLAEGERAYQNADGEWRKWQEWKQIELTGDIDWRFIEPYSGYKQISSNSIFQDALAKKVYEKLVKYDGKVLQIDEVNQPEAYFINSLRELRLTVLNQDSGWGDDYTPTPEEIKAYFNGWQMNNGTFGQPYNGTGTKTWIPLGDTDNSRATTALPTDVSPTIQEGVITHYQLHYKLAEPREVPIEFEGSLRVREGLNQIEIGTGVVVREYAVPRDFGEQYNYRAINARSGGINSKLNYRVNRFLKLYINSVEESRYSIYQHAQESAKQLLGLEQINILKTDFDPTASYSVTYLVLDKHLFTAGLGGVQAEYNTNFATRLEENEKTLIEQVRKLSVVENELFPLLEGEVVDHNLHVENPPLGYYVRYANGLQVCWRTVIHNMNTNFAQQWFYPASFKRPLADNVIATGHPNYFMEDGVVTNNEFWDKLYTITIGAHPDVQQWFTLSRQPHLIDARVKLTLLAIGRWK